MPTVYYKSGHNPTVTKLKCKWSKYITNENLKITCSSGIYKTINDEFSYLLLFGKRKLLSFEVSCLYMLNYIYKLYYIYMLYYVYSIYYSLTLK